MTLPRTATRSRRTAETAIELTLDLDGTGKAAQFFGKLEKRLDPGAMIVLRPASTLQPVQPLL